jgi:DNA mismatch repair protein MutL
MPAIQLLPPSVVNKIAAGEVIERPASVLKELLENSVDAGATRIDVTLEGGGRELIRVSDNGCGIPADQLALALTNHATSKIVSADDLFQVATMGFRGEALSSIAEVSRLTLRTRIAGADCGAELSVVGGVHSAVEPAGCPLGTTIEVRDLFFNTPVRQRFLRTASTEHGHATEAFVRIALAHPQIHCRLVHGGREVHDLAPTENWLERIAGVMGDELAAGLIDVESVDNQVSLWGYAANPIYSRGNNRLQYLFLNGRAIRDRALQHALGEAYRGLLLTGRYPICFLRIDMPPSMADVNVHPTKLEVRFQDGGQIYSQLLGTLRARFLSTDLRATVQVPANSSSIDGRVDDGVAMESPSELVAWAERQLVQQRLDAVGQAAPPPSAPLSLHPIEPRVSEPAEPLRSWGKLPDYRPSPFDAPAPSAARSTDHGGHSSVAARQEEPAKALQLHDRYLVVETDDGLEIIDQHALHERILYEQLRSKVDESAVETQKLLVPEPVDLSSQEAAAVLEHRELLAKMGLAVEPFGGDTVLLLSYPALLAKVPPRDVLANVLECLMASDKVPQSPELLDDLLHTVACKAAVKFGDRLAPGEITALLAHRHLTRNHHHCPHGRPAVLAFSCEELDRRFKRI